MVSTNNLKNGMTLKLDGGELWQVVDWNHHKPGKGGAMVRTKLRNIDSGKTVERTFRAAEDVEKAILDKRELQFLYKEGEDFVFMNTETYDQRHVRPEVLAEKANYLVEGNTMTVLVYENRIVDVELPTSVVLEVTETQPGVAGDTKTNATKPATLETGFEIQVPLFISEGEKIKVDTRTGEYLSRA